MNLAYQVARHLACHMARWPQADAGKTKARIADGLKTGDVWLWPEPKQQELFA